MLPTSHPSQPHIVLVPSVKGAGHQIYSQLRTWVVILPSPQVLLAEPFPLPHQALILPVLFSHIRQFQEAGQTLLSALIVFVQSRDHQHHL